LIFRELEDVSKHLDTAIENEEPWRGDDLDIPAWSLHGHLIAGELADGELLALSTCMHWIANANHWRKSFEADQARTLKKLRVSRHWEEGMKSFFGSRPRSCVSRVSPSHRFNAAVAHSCFAAVFLMRCRLR